MKYLCLAYGDPQKMKALSKGEMDAILRECQPHMEELHKSGHVISDDGLNWETTTIRPRNGAVSVTDGPFTESKEQVGGLFIIEARDLNEAILVASKHPAAHIGEHLGWGIEVRPIADMGRQ
ncbi:MAG TPA: YciI family protein [Spirochaetia bacterium]|nr:YciI family protein [Spirochaetia bacterium]